MPLPLRILLTAWLAGMLTALIVKPTDWSLDVKALAAMGVLVGIAAGGLAFITLAPSIRWFDND